ncbi:MAG: hypothetical protein EAX87_06840 [Candidatus Thorarchaeota archaeon]|nr:hypothetical protein [Candidatus Thorarchaeota archaeon]
MGQSIDVFEHIAECGIDMNTDCIDGLCKQKIQAVDRAIGHHKNEWSVLLKSTKNPKDVEHALRFCQVFHLEPKVKVVNDSYVVLVKNELLSLL